VWLDPKRTSPYQFYQFWLNAADADAGNYIRIFTLKGREEIEALEAEHAQAPHQRALQKALAADITARVHGDQALDQALVASDILFGGATADALRTLDEATLLDVFRGVPQMRISRDALSGGLGILDVIAPDATLFPSRGEARKLLTLPAAAANSASQRCTRSGSRE
jgi:tyrosyl-tRNA synthetase